jgi:hypothetical protein
MVEAGRVELPALRLGVTELRAVPRVGAMKLGGTSEDTECSPWLWPKYEGAGDRMSGVRTKGIPSPDSDKADWYRETAWSECRLCSWSIQR